MAQKNKKSYSTINLFIRSLIFSIYMIVSICVYATVVILSAFLPLRCRWYIIQKYLKQNVWMLKKICHINYVVEGIENIPKHRVGIIMSKHQSTWETFYLAARFHEPAVIVKRELLWTPFFGWAMSLSEPIGIDRNNKSSAMQQIITKGKKALDAGRWILVFPEGTRVPYGAVGQYKIGGARLAAATGYPVLPVAHNAGKLWQRRKFIKQPGTVRVVFGPLIETTGRKPEEVMKLTKDWIESTMQRLMSDE